MLSTVCMLQKTPDIHADLLKFAKLKFRSYRETEVAKQFMKFILNCFFAEMKM
jgi:hypothetical protein